MYHCMKLKTLLKKVDKPVKIFKNPLELIKLNLYQSFQIKVKTKLN